MMKRFRDFWTKVISPIANLLLRLGVTPDMVTITGTIGVATAALVFFPLGKLWIGVLAITCFVFSDLIDGYMARSSGKATKFGAFLDSTLDRIGDAAIFGGLLFYWVWHGNSKLMAWTCLVVLAMGATTSYARARAESVGLEAKGGLAERADRLVPTLVVGFFDDLLPWDKHLYALRIVLWYLAIASTITVIQRVLSVHRQCQALGAGNSLSAGDSVAAAGSLDSDDVTANAALNVQPNATVAADPATGGDADAGSTRASLIDPDERR